MQMFIIGFLSGMVTTVGIIDYLIRRNTSNKVNGVLNET